VARFWVNPGGSVLPAFYQYARECEGLVSELRAALSANDLKELRKDCAALGLKAWDQWFFDHLSVVSSFIAASPADREKRKEWQEPVLRHRLLLAGIQQLTRACNLLDGLHRHGLVSGQSHRQMAARAADAYVDIFLKQPASDWPFDEPDPFS
jgi:hypothetical protein